MKTLQIALALILATSTVHAQVPFTAQPIETIPSGEDVIVPLKPGDPVPFPGQLFANPTALRWSNWLRQYKFRLQADTELQKSLGETQVQLWQEKYKLQQHQYDAVTADLMVRLRTAENEVSSPPWYRTVWFGVTLGVVSTGLAVGLSAYALHGTR